MEGWPHGSVGESSYLGILPDSQAFGVFMREGKSAVFCLLGPVQTGIRDPGSRSQRLDKSTKGEDLG